MSVEIKFDNLWTYRTAKKSAEKEPLSMLDNREYTHVHGELQLIINGKSAPRLGYKDEVCIGHWIEGFADVVKAFKNKEKEYVAWGWEQGIPSFKFQKEGKKAYLSIIDNPGLDAKGEKDWQRIEFLVDDFYTAFATFKDNFLKVIENESPNVLRKWEQKFIKGDILF
jgi:hypothetical protein